MPFTYNLPVPEIPPEALDDSGETRLKRFRVAEGAWIEAGRAVAELESPHAAIQVLANGTGVLRKWAARPGATLRAGDVLGWSRRMGRRCRMTGPIRWRTSA